MLNLKNSATSGEKFEDSTVVQEIHEIVKNLQ